MRRISKLASAIAKMTGAAILVAWAGALGPAQAAGPQPWELGMQPAASPVMREITGFHDFLLWIIFSIAVFVLVLLVYVMVRFRASANPTPSRTTHNSVIEVIWTVVPILILVMIAIPSFKLLYFADRVAKPELTIKATGSQWFWTYEYPDSKIVFDAQLVPDSDLKPGQPRLLETDNHVVLPVNTNIRLLTTANSVIHSWAMPAFGIKLDAVPGRLNETWMRIERPGMYYGQCSELCGINHGFMPITVEAVSKADFAKWVAEARKKFSAEAAPAPAAEVRFARAAAPADR